MKRANEPSKPSTEGHGVDAGTVAGENVGGPLAAIAGMMVGAGAGALVGKALDNADRRASERERNLDKIIGVTDDDLGAAA
jgi:hypothetical protein